ncbi:phosphopantothenoylcysteine decarboxylase / phosphopantothenate--cysteine ligase [Streptomyces sp. Ncost-T6T-2b]|nr:phosphopantothenoylcysteine decarboxylase / phosphopantothenate--cysteine ligase [Streptomyces sp. Ncost-T6T-2b]
MVVAPATADMLAKAAHGLADDLLTNTLLTARCPVVFAPAMHTEMWEHPATQENVATLRRRGAVVIEPAVGRLTGVDTGKGRLPDPGEIFEVCRRVLARGVPEPDLAGRHVVISAGGTREPLDPVRFLGNRSSGKQGYALARTAVARGARVTLIEANTGLPDPAGADVLRVGTAVQLREAVVKAAADADVVVMAAAVADFRPSEYATGKIKKKDGEEAPAVTLVRNPDILAEVAGERGPAGPDRRRIRRRDRRRAGQRACQAPPQGLRPPRGQRGGGAQDLRLGGERSGRPRRRRPGDAGAVRPQGSPRRHDLGSGFRQVPAEFLISPSGE